MEPMSLTAELWPLNLTRHYLLTDTDNTTAVSLSLARLLFLTLSGILHGSDVRTLVGSLLPRWLMATSHALFGVRSNLYFSSLGGFGVGNVLAYCYSAWGSVGTCGGGGGGSDREYKVSHCKQRRSWDADAIDLASCQEGPKASGSETRNVIAVVLVRRSGWRWYWL